MEDETMLFKALREFTTGLLKQLLVNLSGEDGQLWLEEFKKFLRKEKCWVNSLLKRITTAKVQGSKHFCAKDRLKAANVGWTGDNFNKFFLNKVEENIGEVVLVGWSLLRNSLDAPIINDLGPRANSQLAWLFSLLEKQSQGQEGVLLVDGRANVMYIQGSDGNVWAVCANWRSGRRYWNVGANSVENPVEWYAGHQVLSCDCN